MQFLALHLYGPMQSWGGSSGINQVRGSDGHPTRSAILGMVAAALKIDRSDDEAQKALDEALFVAIRVNNQGTILRDYHTVEWAEGKRKTVMASRRDELNRATTGTLVTQRDYRADAFYTVILWSQSEALLTRIEKAMARPGWSMWLGRKTCAPALPLVPRSLTASNLKEAFLRATLKPEVAGLFPGHFDRKGTAIYWQDPSDAEWEKACAGLTQRYTISRKDRVMSHKKRTFSERQEIMGRFEEHLCTSVE